MIFKHLFNDLNFGEIIEAINLDAEPNWSIRFFKEKYVSKIIVFMIKISLSYIYSSYNLFKFNFFHFFLILFYFLITYFMPLLLYHSFLFIIFIIHFFAYLIWYIFNSIFQELTNLNKTIYIFNKAILHIINLLLSHLLKVSHLLFLILSIFPLHSFLILLMSFSYRLLPSLHWLSILSNMLSMVFICFTKWAIISTILLGSCLGFILSLILFENLIHFLFTIFLILPSVSSCIASICWLARFLIILMKILIIIVLAITIILIASLTTRLIVILLLVWASICPWSIILFFYSWIR